jgi:hypothetical protein
MVVKATHIIAYQDNDYYAERQFAGLRKFPTSTEDILRI